MTYDARICSDTVAEPKIPANASLVKPATAEEQEAVNSFLLWVQSVLDWGRSGWTRAGLAKNDICKR